MRNGKQSTRKSSDSLTQTRDFPFQPSGHEPEHVSLYRKRSSEQSSHLVRFLTSHRSQPVWQPSHLFISKLFAQLRGQFEQQVESRSIERPLVSSQELQILGAPSQVLHGDEQGTQIPATEVVPGGQTSIQSSSKRFLKTEGSSVVGSVQ